ncbi:hypothetical protein [Crossiella sp. CA198]|uniref:hypothetical protein n=1 Tax=Crossiella sp. CA198 TaxID=3455607 RepID=UPI003F8D7278
MNIGESVEDSCRRLVRVLPVDYRAAHGEDLVSTLADTVDERGVLPLRERLAVLALAVRLRVVTPVTGPAAAALVALLVLVQTGIALAGLLVGTVSAALFLGQAWTPAPVHDVPLTLDLGGELATQIGQDLVFLAAWLVVLHGLLRGRRFAAPAAAVLAGIPLVLQVIYNPLAMAWPGRLLGVCTVLAALLAWRCAPLSVPGRPRRWLLGLPLATVLSLGQAQVLMMLPEEFQAPVVWALAALVTAAAVLVARGRPWLLLAVSWLAVVLGLAHVVAPLTFDFYPAEPHVPAALAAAVVLAGVARLNRAGAVRRVARR